MTQPHCWHVDADSEYDAPAIVGGWGQEGIGCCSCTAIGRRLVDVKPASYLMVDNIPVRTVGPAIQMGGPPSCPGFLLRMEKHACHVTNTIGYTLLVGLVTVAARALLIRPAGVPSAAVFLDHWYWWLAAPWVAYGLLGFVAHGHREIARINTALVKVRAGLVTVALRRETTYGTAPGTLPPVRIDMSRRQRTRCQSDDDGDCVWAGCPQLRDREPLTTGRHCPLDVEPAEPETRQPGETIVTTPVNCKQEGKTGSDVEGSSMP